jgi:hypothetical protein
MWLASARPAVRPLAVCHVEAGFAVLVAGPGEKVVAWGYGLRREGGKAGRLATAVRQSEGKRRCIATPRAFLFADVWHSAAPADESCTALQVEFGLGTLPCEAMNSLMRGGCSIDSAC